MSPFIVGAMLLFFFFKLRPTHHHLRVCSRFALGRMSAMMLCIIVIFKSVSERRILPEIHWCLASSADWKHLNLVVHPHWELGCLFLLNFLFMELHHLMAIHNVCRGRWWSSEENIVDEEIWENVSMLFFILFRKTWQHNLSSNEKLDLVFTVKQKVI